MSPSYLCRIDEINQSPTAPLRSDSYGNWIPSVRRGDNIRVNAGASGILWYCDGQRIQGLTNNALPPGSRFYKAFSVFYCDGFGFWVLRGDATNPPAGEAWQSLWFDHDRTDYSSYLTNAGTERTLRCQRPDQIWPDMLLPTIYQTRPVPTDQRYGGLKGELAIFLALIAFSMDRQYVRQLIPQMFTGGVWARHSLPHGRVNQRGVVVNVYTCPSSWGHNNTAQELSNYEDGVGGKYYM